MTDDEKKQYEEDKRKEALDYTDADIVNESVKRLSKAFEGAVQQSVDERLKGKAPLDKAKNNVLTAEEEDARKAFANALKF